MISATDLEQFPIFFGLDQGLLTEIARLSSMRTYQDGEICMTEGSVAECLLLLVKGRIDLERRLPENWVPPGSEGNNVVYTLKEKEIFGWSSLIEPGRHTARGRCSQDCEVIAINGRQLLSVLDIHEEASYQFMKRLATVIALRLIDTSNSLIREMANFAAYRSM